MAQALRVIGSPWRLEVLRLLDSGDLSAGEVASTLALSQAQARGHLRALIAAGLVESYPGDGVQRYRVDRRGATLLNASVVSLLGRAGSAPVTSGRPVVEALPMAAPPVPERCLDCENSGFVRSVLGDLDRIIEEAQDYQSRLQQLASQVLAAHEEERKRVARELHDDTAQALTSSLVRLRLLERSADDGDVRRTVEELRELTGGTLDSVRRMAVDLRPAALDHLGLVAALHSYVEKFS
ncbi:MAG TPA: histidine kinase, partial [Dehalococcoidia bacterium]|nr:histidine kinase [Dehalococcoidia bacterium]